MSNTMNIFSAFKTDSDEERNGIVIDYGNLKVQLAYAGGANEEYGKAARRIMKPYEKMLQTGNLPEEQAKKLETLIMVQGCVRTVWAQDPKKADKYHEGKLPTADGKMIDYSEEAFCNLLNTLDPLKQDLKMMMHNRSKFNGGDDGAETEEAKGN